MYKIETHTAMGGEFQGLQNLPDKQHGNWPVSGFGALT